MRFFHLLFIFVLGCLLASCSFSGGVRGLFSSSSSSPSSSAEPVAPRGADLPQEAQADYNQAAGLWRVDDVSSDPKASLELLGRVVAIAPDYAPARRMRGFTLLQLGEKEEAFEEMTRAVRLDPSPAMYASRALLCLRSNLPAAAMRDVDYALRLNPDLASAYAVRGRIRLKEGGGKAACDDFARACSLGNCLALEEAKKEKTCN